MTCPCIFCCAAAYAKILVTTSLTAIGVHDTERGCRAILQFLPHVSCILCFAAVFSNRIFRLNTSSPSPRWEDMTPDCKGTCSLGTNPSGTYRIQNTMVAVNGTLLIYGGASSSICPPLQFDACCDCCSKRQYCLGCIGLRFLWLLSVALCNFSKRHFLHVPSLSK